MGLNFDQTMTILEHCFANTSFALYKEAFPKETKV